MAELDRHDWGTYRCGCKDGTAEHVPGIFRALFDAVDPEEVFDANLEGHVEIGGNLFEVAVPATSVILAALAGDLAPFVRSSLMLTLCRIVSGDAHQSEVVLGRSELANECRYWVREGIWVVLQQGFQKEAESAVDVMEIVELDDKRLRYYKNVLASRVKRRQ